MKQSILKSLMLMAMLFTSGTVWSEDFEVGGIITMILHQLQVAVKL